MTEEYLNSDHLSVSVKAEMSEMITDAYGAFGWQLSSKDDGRRFGKVAHMDFTRDHFIEGKDRLQFLQVRFDVTLNFIGRARRRTPARATSFGIFLGLVGLAFAIYGGLVVAFFQSVLYLACGAALIAAGASFIVLAALCSVQMYRGDAVKYGAVIAVLEENLRAIIKEAAEITGYDHADAE